jgi:hypothetical protein
VIYDLIHNAIQWAAPFAVRSISRLRMDRAHLFRRPSSPIYITLEMGGPVFNEGTEIMIARTWICRLINNQHTARSWKWDTALAVDLKSTYRFRR